MLHDIYRKNTFNLKQHLTAVGPFSHSKSHMTKIKKTKFDKSRKDLIFCNKKKTLKYLGHSPRQNAGVCIDFDAAFL